MTFSEPIGALKEVRDLAEGFSEQSKLANRTWFVLFAIMVLVVVPDSSLDTSGRKVLPFGFGAISRGLFDSVSLYVLCIVTISFCSARAQALIAYDLAHRRITDIQNQVVDDKLGSFPLSTIPQRRFFDIMTTATLVRTGPLGVLAKHTYQKWGYINKIASVYFIILKALAMIVFLGIPTAAVIFAWLELLENAHVNLSFKVIGTMIWVITMIPLIQNLFVDAMHTKIVAEKLWYESTSEPVRRS